MPCPNCQDPAFNTLCIRCLHVQQGDIDAEYICDREQCGHIALYSELQELEKVKENPVGRGFAMLLGIITIGIMVVIFLGILAIFLPALAFVILVIRWAGQYGPGGDSFTCPSCRRAQMRPGYSPRGEYLMRRAKYGVNTQSPTSRK